MQDLAWCCSERLGTIRKWIGVAILRALELPCVPEEMQAEPLHCKSLPFVIYALCE